MAGTPTSTWWPRRPRRPRCSYARTDTSRGRRTTPTRPASSPRRPDTAGGRRPRSSAGEVTLRDIPSRAYERKERRVNKSELIAAVAAHVGSDQAQARRHVDAVFETIMNSVVDGERVVVTGFGTFERVTRPARTVRNPRTGRPMQVASSQAPRFSVGRTFKENVSGGLAASAQVASPVSAEVSGDVAEAAAVAANGNAA